jgi:hypothetical protein
MVVLLAWGCAVLAAAVLHPPPTVQSGATVVHVLALAVGFGAVVVIDWQGLLWLAGRRGLHESIRLAASVTPLVWLGLVGLLASGAFLDPDMTSLLTWTKLLFVLAVGLNGATSARIARVLRALPPTTSAANLPWPLQARVVVATAVSEIAWWGAVAIGFATSIRRP